MTDLTELQGWMAELLRHRRALPNDSGIAAQVMRHVAGNDRLSPVEQVEIYRRQFWLRHTSSLVEDFPGVGGILGQADWERLIEEYLDVHPPKSPSLRELGQDLPSFIVQCDWLPHRQLCWDMSQLEWAYIEIFDAPDAAPLDPTRLSALSPQEWCSAQLILNPALRLLQVEYPVAELRKALREPNGHTMIPALEPQNLVVYRGPNRNLYHQVIENVGFELLCGLAEELPLLGACERAIERMPNEAERLQTEVGRWFQGWAELRWVTAVR